MTSLTLEELHDPAEATTVLAVILGAFGARPPLDPPAPALAETLEGVAAALAAGGGLLARLDGRPVGALLLAREDGSLHLRRVSVLPEARGRGVARALRRTAEEVARREGLHRVHVVARVELPETVRFWCEDGYAEVRREGTALVLAKALPVTLTVPTADDMRAVGGRLAGLLGPGDLVILTGDLGAGKTTLTQGLGAGLQVRGDVTSPTFVISRVHPSLVGGPALVHVDAYRLGPATGSGQAALELDDLDLDVSLEDSVTVVEWGEGLAEGLAEDRLEVAVRRTHGAEAGEGRTVVVTPAGPRWAARGLAGLVA